MSLAARRFQRTTDTSTTQTVYSLWPTNPIPNILADSDSSNIEIGTKFYSSVPAQVLGVRFYKGISNTGVHSGSLWTTSGTRLTTVTFTGETASGWQQMLFPSPVSISANTTYVVSYFAPSGHYSNNANYFTSVYASGVLTAPATGTSPNGVFVYTSTSAFPTQTFGATNYWVDVLITTASDSTPPSAPGSLSASPDGSFASLNWLASSDGVGVAGYRIYRDGSEIGTSTTISYTDSTTSPSTAYTYTVRAYDYSDNLSALSNAALVTTGSNMTPIASFTINPVGLTVYVNASTSNDPDGSIASYAWDFGDGGTATGVTSSRAYAADGNYTITLTVTDNAGAVDSDSQSTNVAASAFVANVINNPHLGGYPDETNTGVPSGVTLTPSGSITVTQNGAVIEGLDISGQVVVNADNVTIRNCRITSNDFYPFDYGGTGLLVEDTEIIGLSYTVTSGLGFDNYTARRVNIHGMADGFKANSNVLIEDCYVHDLIYDAEHDTHNDGVQTTGGSNVTIRHTTIKLSTTIGANAAIQIGTEGSPNSDWLVTDNLLDGGGWIINSGSGNTSMVFTNNRFTHNYGYGVGVVGGSTWTGNYYDNNGDPA